MRSAPWCVAVWIRQISAARNIHSVRLSNYHPTMPRLKLFLVAVATICFTSRQGEAHSAGERVEKLADDYWNWRISESPEYGTKYGFHANDDRVEEFTEEAFQRQLDKAAKFLTEIEKVARKDLNKQDKITLDILEHNLQTYIDGYDYRKFGLYNAYSSLSRPIRDWRTFIGQMKFNNVVDYEKYMRRLEKFPAQMNQTMALMEDAIYANTTLYEASFIGAVDEMDAVINGHINETLFYQPFLAMPDTIRNSKRIALRTSALRFINESLIPVVQEMRRFVTKEYLPNLRTEAGVGSLPGGREFYQQCLKWHTTTDMTSDEVHQLGLQEVDRIYDKMIKIMVDSGFDGSLHDYVAQLRNNTDNFYQSEDAMLQGFKDIAAFINGKLPLILGKIPEAPLQIVKSDNPGGTLGFYADPSLDGSRPGRFIANVFDPETKLKFDMDALTLHEAEPGHHTQTSFAIEEDMPNFRRAIEFRKYFGVPFNWPFMTAYSEGWALYCEALGEEMGVYTDPNTLFGRYSSEIFRAARLVVDTGIHVKGWNRDDAVDFIANFTVLPRKSIINEVNRYISWPGQACSYKVGELKIWQLRRKAEEALGDEFDVRLFHNEVLRLGPAPLSLLEDFIDDWIEESIRPISSATIPRPIFTITVTAVVSSILSPRYHRW